MHTCRRLRAQLGSGSSLPHLSLGLGWEQRCGPQSRCSGLQRAGALCWPIAGCSSEPELGTKGPEPWEISLFYSVQELTNVS